MLGRNLVSLTKAESYAWSSGAPTEILAIISRILESDSQTPGGKLKWAFYIFSLLTLSRDQNIKHFSAVPRQLG